MAIGDGYQHNYKSALGLAKETTWGTFVTASTFIEFDSESLKRAIPIEKINAVNSERSPVKFYLSNETVSGGIEGPVNVAADAFVMLLKNALGGTCASTALSAGAYSHVLYVGDQESNANTSTATDTKGLSFEVRRGANHVWRISGGRVNKMSIKGEIGQPIKFSAEIVAKTASLTTALSTTVVYTDATPQLWTQVVITDAASVGAIPGSAQTYQNFEVNIDNKLMTDMRNLGSRQISALPIGGFDVSMKLTQRFDTSTSHDYWLAETPRSFRIAVTGATIGAQSPQYLLQIDLPKCVLAYDHPTVNGREGVLTHELPYMCLRDNTTTGYEIRATVQNATASYP